MVLYFPLPSCATVSSVRPLSQSASGGGASLIGGTISALVGPGVVTTLGESASLIDALPPSGTTARKTSLPCLSRTTITITATNRNAAAAAATSGQRGRRCLEACSGFGLWTLDFGLLCSA